MGTAIYEKYRLGHNFEGRKTLNLGCGFAKFTAPNVVNMDMYDVCKPDVVWDANKVPLPFESGTFDLVIAHHIMEHLPNWWETFCDCARILKDGGVIEIYLPGQANDSQMGYRDHVSYINQNSFYGIFDLQRPGSNAWAAQEKFTDVQRMTGIHAGIVVANDKWIKLMPKFMYHWCNTHLRNFSLEQRFFFKKLSKEEFEKKRGIVWDKR